LGHKSCAARQHGKTISNARKHAHNANLCGVTYSWFANKEAAMKTIVVVLGFLLACNAYARTTLELQSRDQQCGYKANLVGFVVTRVRQHQQLEMESPEIRIIFRSDTTDAERQLVAEYLNYAWEMSKTELSPEEASKQTFEVCMNAVSAER